MTQESVVYDTVEHIPIEYWESAILYGVPKPINVCSEFIITRNE